MEDPKNKITDKDEHMVALNEANEVIKTAEQMLQMGRKRLQNAIDKYEGRSKSGPPKHF